MNFEEAIIDALAEAGYISDELATNPDRFAAMVQVVKPHVASAQAYQHNCDLLERTGDNVMKRTAEDKAAIIRRYRLAFEAANPGKRVTVKVSSPGWYQLVNGFGRGDKYRIGTLEEMAERLEARVN